MPPSRPKPPRKRMILSACAVAAAMAAATVYTVYYVTVTSGPAFIDPADKALVMQGKPIYTQYCAACHGASLQGQPNWRKRRPDGRLPAPPHDKTGHTWHHPDAMLIDMVKNGLVPGKTSPPGYVSDMPGYAGILSDEEIIAVLAYIKSTWPPDVLKAQKEVTMQ